MTPLKKLFHFLTLCSLIAADLSEEIGLAIGKAYPANATHLPTMPNVEYALRGYNLLIGNPLAKGHEADPGFANVIFESNYSGASTADLRYQIPDGVSIFSKTICDINFVSSTYSNEKAYHTDLKIPIKVEFSGWNAAFMGNFQYQKTINEMSSNMHSFVKTESTCSVYEISLDSFDPPKLKTGFRVAAKSLEDSSPDTIDGREVYKRFVDVYGTHFIHNTHMGAKYAEQSELSKISREKLQSEGININLAASELALFNLGISSSLSEHQVDKLKEEILSQSFTSFGSRPPADGSTFTWTSSAFTEPLPISYSLLPIENLFTQPYMADSGINYLVIQPKLKSFMQSYCSTMQDSLGISSCNGPRGGCSGGNECHHNAHCEEADDNNYVCQCNNHYFGNGISCSGWNIQSFLEPDIHGDWGQWGEVQVCPNNSYAYAIALKVDDADEVTFLKDDTALNGVKLYCRSADKKTTGEITSQVGDFGSWKNPKECSSGGFLNGFHFRVESDVFWDDVMAANLDASCESGEILEGEGSHSWGSWSSWTYCQQDAVLCGLQTRVLESQGPYMWQDDVGLTDIRFLCCQI